MRYDDEVVAYLAQEGFDAKFGARPLRRVIQRLVEDSLSEALHRRHATPLGDTVQLRMSDGKIAVSKAQE